MVGIAEHVGHSMCYKVLTDDTQKVIYCSRICAATSKDPNLRIEPPGGEADPIIKALRLPPKSDASTSGEPIDGEPTHSDGNNDQESQSTNFAIDDLIGRTFLLPPQEDGQRFHARIVGLLEDQQNELERDPARVKFQTSVNDGQFEELLSFAEIADHINDAENNDPDHLWKFKRIVSHEGPLRPGDPNYNGGAWNVNVEWENGEVTAEPLFVIGADSPFQYGAFG